MLYRILSKATAEETYTAVKRKKEEPYLFFRGLLNAGAGRRRERVSYPLGKIARAIVESLPQQQYSAVSHCTLPQQSRRHSSNSSSVH